MRNRSKLSPQEKLEEYLDNCEDKYLSDLLVRGREKDLAEYEELTKPKQQKMKYG
jgi:hypothetical protein